MCSRDELGHVLRVVAEVRIHQEYERTSADLQAIDVCTAQSHLAWPRMNHHFAFTKDALQLLCNFNGAIRRIILNNHHFIVQFATHTGGKAGSTIEKQSIQKIETMNIDLLLSESLVNHPKNDWEVFPLIVSRHDNTVFSHRQCPTSGFTKESLQCQNKLKSTSKVSKSTVLFRPQDCKDYGRQ